MKETDRKAGRGMITFVVTIFVIACIIALLYTLVVHPGYPS